MSNNYTRTLKSGRIKAVHNKNLRKYADKGTKYKSMYSANKEDVIKLLDKIQNLSFLDCIIKSEYHVDDSLVQYL